MANYFWALHFHMILSEYQTESGKMSFWLKLLLFLGVSNLTSRPIGICTPPAQEIQGESSVCVSEVVSEWVSEFVVGKKNLPLLQFCFRDITPDNQQSDRSPCSEILSEPWLVSSQSPTRQLLQEAAISLSGTGLTICTSWHSRLSLT